MRGQTTLPALAFAFVLLTATVVFGVTTAADALTGAERDALERQEATGLSDRLVAGDAPTTSRANVLTEGALDTLDVDAIRDRYGLSDDASVLVQVGGVPVAAEGDTQDGTTVERIVLVEDRTARTIEPSFDVSPTMTLPRRSANATLAIRPSRNTTVRSVWVNDRVVLQNRSGLNGTFEVSLSSLETAQFRFDAAGDLEDGDVTITFYPPQTRKEILAVTVDV